MKKKSSTFFSIGLLLLIWQLFASYINQPKLIPGLPGLIHTLLELLLTKNFYLSVVATILRGITGMVLSLLMALFSAIIFTKKTWIYDLFRPLLAIMRSVPVISFILLALIFLHTESIPLLIGFLTIFPLLTENLTKGFRNIHTEFTNMEQLFLLGNRNKLLLVTYPLLKPFLYSGLTSAAGFGWRAIIMGEVLTQCSFGIGSEMKKAQSFIAVPELIAWTTIAILISWISDQFINRLAGYKWKIKYAPHSINPPILTEPSIQLKDIGYIYGISHFSYTFTSDNIYGISAPSGTGKTTLLKLISGILKPISGEIKTNTTQGFASVSQQVELLPELTIAENIALVLARYCTEEVALKKSLILLKQVGLDSHAHKLPQELSYGQQQRVAIARALAFPSPVLLMDEPFKGIDKDTARQLIKLIKQQKEKHKQIILFTTHNPEDLNQLADIIILLENKSTTKSKE